MVSTPRTVAMKYRAKRIRIPRGAVTMVDPDIRMTHRGVHGNCRNCLRSPVMGRQAAVRVLRRGEKRLLQPAAHGELRYPQAAGATRCAQCQGRRATTEGAIADATTHTRASA